MPQGGWPFEIDLALNKVANWESERKFGFNSATGTTEETIWRQGGVINWPSTASKMKVSSGSALDDVGSTGAEKIQVYGLDTNWDLQDEEVDLDGQTQVETTGTYIRVFRVVVTQAGSGDVNAGIIYVYTGTETNGVPDTSTNIYATVAVGDNQTLQCAYSIPKDYRGLVRGIRVSSSVAGNNYVIARVKVRELGGVFTVKDYIVTAGQPYLDNLQIPLVLPEQSDIMVTGQSDTTDVDVGASLHIYLVGDDER